MATLKYCPPVLELIEKTASIKCVVDKNNVFFVTVRNMATYATFIILKQDKLRKAIGGFPFHQESLSGGKQSPITVLKTSTNEYLEQYLATAKMSN